MITEQDVKYIANLAHLHVPDAEMPMFAQQLNDVLKHVDQLSELDEILDKENIQPTMHTWATETTLLREDVMTPSMRCEDILRECAEVKQGAFAVPKIIDA
jgi:aspartyl/glutamyl-tRNA(Asn/Gln) amidotransferase C subunit